MRNKEDWFTLKKYPHIGKRLNPRDRFAWIEDYITNTERISEHSFLPFIHKVKKVRKFRKEYDKDSGQPIKTGSKALRTHKVKPRHLHYASHLDSLIYRYYAELLVDKYEKKIEENDLNDVVLAYRKIPINSQIAKSSNKCNINFANDAFRYIKNYPYNEFVVITFDIKSFFDNLNHKKLNEAWCTLLGCGSRLPKDHFNVYKSLTRYSYIDLIDIFKLFQNEIIVQERDQQGKLRPPRRKRISRIKYLKKEGAIAICTKAQFLKHKNQLVRNRKYVKNESGQTILRDFGIPQGTSMSSVLANAYMLEFDIAMKIALNQAGGIYQRYSDDMLVVCPSNYKNLIIQKFKSEIDKAKLDVQDDKTQIFHFKRDNSHLKCGQETESNSINWNKNLIYLGFDFDGNVIKLKPGSLSGYYRKMKKAVARSIRYSKMTGPNQGEIFKRRILKKYSYKGASRKRTWIYSTKVHGFIKSDRFDWGNFLAYTKKASRVMDDNIISQQCKRHWNKLNSLIRKGKKP